MVGRGSGAAGPRHRLPAEVRPLRVKLALEVDPERSPVFRGRVTTQLCLERPQRRLRLHAAELRVSRPRIRCGGRALPARIVPLPGLEMIELVPERPLPAGEATLELDFRGRLRGDLCGLYAARAGSRRYAFTQLEAAEARKLFPCFDEPAMKARFRISVTTGARQRVLSNAPVARSERRAGGRKTVWFRETPPLSTYLLALAVGDLRASGPRNLGPTPIRVWHTPGKARLTGFALETAAQCLARLERYFGVAYPYRKLDLVAVPDFEFGAMENAGAVFFRETLLLLDPATATLGERKRAAEVICHELAHMWFGDLVTMAWWDDLWLNESFATWMAFHVVDSWRPEWKMWHAFQHGRAAALGLDALRHTHPVYCPVRTPAEAGANFDLITYEKGASVVRMLERYLGPAVFRRGVRVYIRRHREGNARADDLWRALSEASGQDVGRIARAWIEREGHPLVELRRRGRRLELRQERFRLRPGAPRAAGCWPIPWVGRAVGGRGGLERRLLTRRREAFRLRQAPDFVYGNADEAGFLRPLHGAAELREVARRPSRLRAVERMGLVDHQWALACAGRADLGTFLDLADALANERDPDVLLTLARPLRFLGDALVPDAAPACESGYRSWLRARFGAPLSALGWQPRRDESDEQRLRRAALLSIAAVGDGRLAAQARARCERYLADRRSLDANLADAVVSLAARDGDARLHERFWRAAQAARTPQDGRRFLLALGEFRAPRLVARTLALCLTPAVATQDVVLLLARSMANPAAGAATWAFVQRRWSALRRRMPPLLTSRLVEATPALRTPAYRAEVAAFFRAHPLPSGERALRQALERFDWYRGFRRPAGRALAAWLASR